MNLALVMLSIVALALAALAVHVAVAFRFMIRETSGDRYFSRTLAGRRALREEMQRRGRWVVPILELATKLVGFKQPVMNYHGVTAPGQICTQELFRQAKEYHPRRGDIFVATQMKCGTTFMQQIVYETLCHGHGDLSDAGLRHMYALSPWIESNGAVPMERAARIGERGDRIIKTHLPTSLCPYSAEARYIYVTRHPFTCFASCVDFVTMLAGPFASTYPEMLDWYCSDAMWWRSWPEHVDGWWRWAQERENVLFVHYEDMLDDLDGAVGQVAAFLDVKLEPAERAEVVRKSDYRYMKEHEELFEMAAPSMLQDYSGASFFQSGKKDRAQTLDAADRARIAAFCRERLTGSPYPLARFYPDVAAAPSP